MTAGNPAAPDDEPVVLDADEILDPASVPLTDREPVIDRLRPAQRRLLFRKHAMGEFVPPGYDAADPSSPTVWRGPNGLDEADIAGMLEVAWLLGLDPFTPGEIWCARSKAKEDGKDAGKLLIMVGRDGRRKIVQRNGLRMRGDVVREHDEFSVEHTEPRKTIRHSYSGFGTEKRGKVVGAWSEVWDPRTNETRGFFAADIAEYKPKDASAYSPWSHQESAMILAATERQSTAMGTPLSGLIGEGEAEINQAPDRPVLGGDPAGDDRQLGQAVDVDGLPASVREVLTRAEQLGHAGLAYAATAEMFTAGKPDEVVAVWVADAHTELDQFEERQRPATTVEDAGGGAVGVRRAPDAERAHMTIQKAPLAEPGPEDESGPRQDAERSLDEKMQAAHEDPDDAQDAIAAIEQERAAASVDPGQESFLP